MVNGYCVTHFGGSKSCYDTDFPDKFVALPRIGDYIQGKVDGNSCVFRVKSVSHCCTDKDKAPYIMVGMVPAKGFEKFLK
jgi:hypothetical protein